MPVLAPAMAAELTAVIPAVKRSVVGVGTFERTRSPSTVFFGTGFVVGDGLSVITNAHVVPEKLDEAHMEQLGIVTSDGDMVRFRPAQLVARDTEHDLAHLRLSGPPLPALKLGDSDGVGEGQSLAFTGYPLGMVLGLHAATHRATLAAITPIVMPSLNSRKLDPRQLAQLQRYVLRYLPARRYGLSRQQRQPGLRPGQRRSLGRHQCRVRQGAQGNRDQPIPAGSPMRCR
jgi:hypothetical protein